MAKDLFSKQAEGYSQYRPIYPNDLFQYIFSFVKNKSAAWDAATGNGQAAVVLAQYFEKVFATDISEKQLQQAVAAPNIHYSAGAAEKTGFPNNHFDLITVAQAYHWFNFDEFKKEVMRVARPGAVVAVWGYSLIVCEDEAVNDAIKTFYKDVTGPYWDKERKYVDEEYSTVQFPYDEQPAKNFKTIVSWQKERLTGYLNTWSSIQHFIKANNYNPVENFAQQLQQIWPEDSRRQFYFPVFCRVGLVSK